MKTNECDKPFWYEVCRLSGRRRQSIRQQDAFLRDADVAYREKNIRARLRDVQGRAAKDDLPYDLDYAWLRGRLESGKCERTGIPFTKIGSGGAFGPFSMSLDRVDPAMGYTKDNVMLVVWIYNAAKGKGTHADVERMAYALLGIPEHDN